MPTGPAKVLAFELRDTETEFGATISRRGSETHDTEGGQMVWATPQLSSRSVHIVPLQDLGDGRCFIHPLYVAIDVVGDDYRATSNDLALIGTGDTEFEAVDDLREQVAELYESLAELRPDLGPHLANQLAFLDRLAGEI